METSRCGEVLGLACRCRTKVYANVFRKWGTPSETVTRKVVTLAVGKEMHDIATVKVE